MVNYNANFFALNHKRSEMRLVMLSKAININNINNKVIIMITLLMTIIIIT